jgi:hypothetical protein
MKSLSGEQKTLIKYGAGAGLGIVVPFALKKYVDPAYPSPLVPMLGVWGKWSTFIPVATGAGALIVTLLMRKKVKNKDTTGMVAMYGFTSLITGAMNGLTDMGYLGMGRPRASAANVYNAPIVRPPARLNGAGAQMTPTGISNKIIRA